MQDSASKPIIGLALGAGAARGWGHIGVIKALAELGITPQVVCGASAGALVGAAYVTNHLDRLEAWLRKLRRIDIFRLLDARLSGGGFIQGQRLMQVLGKPLKDMRIEDLPIPFAAVATELETGRERWLREGMLLDAVRASIAVPGLFAPARWQDTWLVDGGLVNPVPVSVCRALGADLVIAVNVNGGLVSQFAHVMQEKQQRDSNGGNGPVAKLVAKLNTRFKFKLPALMANTDKRAHEPPGMFDVLTAAANIVQDRVTRARMAGEPPDILLTPRLAHIRLMEFDRAGEAIEEGVMTVQRSRDALLRLARGERSEYLEGN